MEKAECQRNTGKLFKNACLSPFLHSFSSLPILLHPNNFACYFIQKFYILASSLLALYRLSDYVYHCIEVPITLH